MKIGFDVYCLCDKCKEPIKRNDEYILCTKRKAGSHGAEKQVDLCLKCFKTLS